MRQLDGIKKSFINKKDKNMKLLIISIKLIKLISGDRLRRLYPKKNGVNIPINELNKDYENIFDEKLVNNANNIINRIEINDLAKKTQDIIFTNMVVDKKIIQEIIKKFAE